MNSNSFHDFINLDVVHYFFELARRIATMSDKVHAIELSHFIKLFFYSIQNRDTNKSFYRIIYNFIDITTTLNKHMSRCQK